MCVCVCGCGNGICVDGSIGEGFEWSGRARGMLTEFMNDIGSVLFIEFHLDLAAL